jgi:hypothetical protein
VVVIEDGISTILVADVVPPRGGALKKIAENMIELTEPAT